MKKTLVKIGGVLIITALMSAVTMAEEKPSAADSAANAKKLEAMGSHMPGSASHSGGGQVGRWQRIRLFRQKQ